HLDLRRRPRRNHHVAPQLPILRSATVLHRKTARRQQYHIAVASINLRLKIKIRGEPPGLRRTHMSRLVAKNEARRRGRPVVVPDAQFHRNGGLNVEEHRHLAAKTEVLMSLPAIE